MTINRYSLNKTALNSKKLVNVTNIKVSRQQYCLFYNRFGRCSRGAECRLIHDPKRVALCPRFLRGTCKLDNCPYSHVISEEKMPLCSFYAKGMTILIYSRKMCSFIAYK